MRRRGAGVGADALAECRCVRCGESRCSVSRCGESLGALKYLNVLSAAVCGLC
jgi:hypothetical protein